ncbi:ATP-binding cassette domain-containing protein [Holzapfeliella sp. He02]|uniref:ATP-binding cassette domain-containing protein n=1 Tax=Holzapfeliella saturejae TaxID=3082953 RepID=A0ABU8SHM6_9LACO
MSYITMKGVSYSYQTYQKKSGLKANLADLIKRHYQSKQVLDNISLSIKQGEKVGLLGPNGSGKSTIIKLLTGILQTTSGTISVANNTPDTNNADFLAKIGVVMGQKSQLNWDLPAADTFKILKSIYKIKEADYQKRLSKYLSMFQLEEVVYVPVRKLSLGERTKLEVIAALLHGPELLILDEPTIGMDIVSQHALHSFINEINRLENVTILLVSHQMADIEAITSHLLVLLDGHITFDGSVHQFIKKAQLPKPQITITHHTDQSPIIAQEHTQFKTDSMQTTITDYEDESTITLKLKDIQNFQIDNPSLEDSLYELFKKRKE